MPGFRGRPGGREARKEDALPSTAKPGHTLRKATFSCKCIFALCCSKALRVDGLAGDREGGTDPLESNAESRSWETGSKRPSSPAPCSLEKTAKRPQFPKCGLGASRLGTARCCSGRWPSAPEVANRSPRGPAPKAVLPRLPAPPAKTSEAPAAALWCKHRGRRRDAKARKTRRKKEQVSGRPGGKQAVSPVDPRGLRLSHPCRHEAPQELRGGGLPGTPRRRDESAPTNIQQEAVRNAGPRA